MKISEIEFIEAPNKGKRMVFCSFVVDENFQFNHVEVYPPLGACLVRVDFPTKNFNGSRSHTVRPLKEAVYQEIREAIHKQYRSRFLDRQPLPGLFASSSDAERLPKEKPDV